MDMTPRIRQILNFLLTKKSTVTDQEIAEALGISKRTVLREMEEVGRIIKEHGLTYVRKKGEGSRIEGEEEQKEALRRKLAEGTDTTETDKTRRRNRLRLELLRSPEPRKLFYYSNLFGVSEATISNDLEALDKWATENHLTIVRKPGFGVRLTGNEKSYRSALQQVLNESMKNEGLQEVGENIYNLMNEEILSGVGQTLEEVDAPYLKKLTNDAYLGLMIHLAVAVERIKLGELVEPEEVYDASMEEGYEIAKTIAEALEEAFGIRIPETEINNILLHIRGAKLHYTSGEPVQADMDSEELMEIVNEMIDTFDAEFAGEMRYEEDFIRGLMVHLEPAIYRMKNGMSIHNPLLEEIRAEYPGMFENCKKAAAVIEKRTGLAVNEAEIGYLCMHFGAAGEKIQSRKKKRRTVHIGVICASGFGLARLMLAKLRAKLSDRDVILAAYGSDEISQHIITKTDFFISGINVDRLCVDYVMVSPLITQRDLLQIDVKINEYAEMPKKQEDSDFSRQLDEINEIILRVRGLLRRYRHKSLSGDEDLDSLLTELTDELTDTKKAAAILRADILAREKLMSQLFPELGIALFHCRSNAVREPQILTASGRRGKPFTDPKLTGIHSVLMMVIPNDDHRRENGELMGRISSALIEDPEFVGTIRNGEEEMIRNKLQGIVKSYFSELLNVL